MTTDDSFIDFKCPYCGEVTTFAGDTAGQVQECPTCSESLLVPDDGSEVGRVPPIPITTPRLTLRRLVTQDWRDLLECLSDEAQFLYLDGQPSGEEEILRWLDADSHVRLTTPHAPFCLGLELKDGAKLIGHLTLNFQEPHRRQAALSLFVNRKFQRQGFATEALAAALDFCLAGIGLHRVTAACDSRHEAARRLCEKLGLRREGQFLEDRFLYGQWVNTLHYARLQREHLAAGNPPPKTGAA
jgi:RimJ/RimL family protein N-acetyltransferase